MSRFAVGENVTVDEAKTKPRLSRRIARVAMISAGLWLCLVGLPSVPLVRAWLMTPLFVHDSEAHGDAAYVMAGGETMLERMRAAADLYHFHRVSKIYILNEHAASGFHFQEQRAMTKGELSQKVLEFWGVPADRIERIEASESTWFGSLSEAQALAKLLPAEVKSLVVVSSAPHMRRSLLCFERSLPTTVAVSGYAASSPVHSSELYSPLWQEYGKLIVYYLYLIA